MPQADPGMSGPTRGPARRPPRTVDTGAVDRASWNQRYSSTSVWSGRPNAALVRHLSDAAPGSALDIGCGEGADALWLARHGWAVVGVDWAGAALQHAREHALAAGAAGSRVRFAEADVSDPAALAALAPAAGFDLVSVAFLHPEPDTRRILYGHLPDLLAPGGRLLVIAHDPSHGALGLGGPPAHRLLGPADIVVALHLPGDTEVLVAQVEPREDAGQVVARDAVVVVRRAG